MQEQYRQLGMLSVDNMKRLMWEHETLRKTAHNARLALKYEHDNEMDPYRWDAFAKWAKERDIKPDPKSNFWRGWTAGIDAKFKPENKG